jgi:hypothetical protein
MLADPYCHTSGNGGHEAIDENRTREPSKRVSAYWCKADDTEYSYYDDCKGNGQSTLEP